MERTGRWPNEYWLEDAAWATIEPLIPLRRCGAKPTHDRRVISGIVHVLKFGGRWRDCPALHGPHTTIYNRFNRWSRAGIWQATFDRRVSLDHADLQPTSKAMLPFDQARYKSRNVIERDFSRLTDWRRVATRYDKLAEASKPPPPSPLSSSGEPNRVRSLGLHGCQS